MLAVIANLRDLGGLPTRDGRSVCRGVLFRGGAPDHADLDALGIRTVIDLRNDDERAGARAVALHFPLDGIEDRAFWDQWQSRPEFGTPYYFAPWLEHFPGRAAPALNAIASAPEGGVLFHCQGGRDRSGLIAILLLAALDVEPEAIADDYCRSGREPELDAVYERAGTTPHAVVLQFLRGLDLAAALPGVDRDALRRRFIDGH